MIKNILFDYGGVICDLDFGACKKTFAEMGCSIENAMTEGFREGNILQRMDNGMATSKEFFEGVRLLGKAPQLGDNEILRAWNSILVGVPPQRFEAIKKLSEKYNLYLLSNCNALHWEVIFDRLSQHNGENIWNYFRQIFLSFRMHLEKPHKEIYEALVQEARIRPEETLFIDDRQDNVDGASEVGFNVLRACGDQWIEELGVNI